VGHQWILDNFSIKNHFATKDEDHTYIGDTSYGLAAKLDKRLLEADLRIAIGLVEPHLMAGYSGGRKLIVPGVSHADTITQLHNAHFIGHPKAANCVLEGNPLHEQQLEITRLMGGALAINLVIDHKRRVSFINFGEIEQSHLKAVEYIRPYVEVFVPHKYQTVLTSSAGYPLDATYYQTIKGMVAASQILAPNGDLIIVSEMSEGLGSQEFVDSLKLLKKLGIDGYSQDIASRQFAAIDAWQTQKLIEPLKIGNVFLYTHGLQPKEYDLTCVHVTNDLRQIISALVGQHKKLAVIPEGPYVFPFHAPA
jgi:nickel-dependent lactate racemase